MFGRRKTPVEMLRQHQRALNKAMRDVDRERTKMEQSEKKLIVDIKNVAKTGQMDAVKIMAKDLVRTRRYIKQFILMRANMQAVSMKIHTLTSTTAIATALSGVGKTMTSMNKQMNLPQLHSIIREFEKQSNIMDMKENVIEDAVDDTMTKVDDEEESDKVVAQVFDELGLQLSDELNGLPGAMSASASAAATRSRLPVAASEPADTELQERLDNLRRE